MLSFTVRMHFDHADHDAVAEMLRSLTVASRQEPGCVSYIAHFLAEDPTTVVIYEQYTDEAALEQHRNSAHFDRHAMGGLYRLMRHRQIENLDVIAD